MRGSWPTCRVCHSLVVQAAVPNNCKATLGEQSCRRHLTIDFRRRHRGVYAAVILLAADKAVARPGHATTRDNLQLRVSREGPRGLAGWKPSRAHMTHLFRGGKVWGKLR